MATADQIAAEHAARRADGLLIDTESAEVMFDMGDVGDPYDLRDRAPGEEFNVGRRYFARSPGDPGGDWVWFGDLPKETETALWKKHGAELAFPAVPG